MLGSEFIAQFSGKGLLAWEAAALQLARADSLTPWPWVDLPLTDGVHQLVLRVQADVVAIGTFEDHVRLPLTPGVGQSILNLQGWLYPTPWIVYQMWRAAPLKLEPTFLPNAGANLVQYQEHSRIVDEQIRGQGGAPEDPRLRAGMKKHVVVSNIEKAGRVLIFGWYRPSPPAPDVFDDGRAMASPGRQPVQPRSNVHGDFYVDYSHGIHAVHGTCLLDGRPAATADVYADPALAKLVSNEGPLRKVRYPSPVQPFPGGRPAGTSSYQAAFDVVPDLPLDADPGLAALVRGRS